MKTGEPFYSLSVCLDILRIRAKTMPQTRENSMENAKLLPTQIHGNRVKPIKKENLYREAGFQDWQQEFIF